MADQLRRPAPVLAAICGLALAALPALAQEGSLNEENSTRATQSQPAERAAEVQPEPAVDESPEAAEARAVLEEAIKALEALESFSMRASYRAQGAFSEMFPQMDALIIGWRGPVAAPPGSADEGQPNAWDLRITGTGKRSANAEDTPFDAIRRDWDRRATFEWLDHEARQLVRRRDSGARGEQIRLVRELLNLNVFTAFPYRAVMRTGTLAMAEPATVNGVETVVVRHDPQQGSRYTLYHFGKEDKLLRRVEDRFEAPGGMQGALILEYSDVRPNVGVAGTTREIEAPDGYSEVGVRLDPRRLALDGDTVSNMPEADPAQPIIVRRAGLPFSLETTGGATVTNESLHGKVTVLGFWATWVPGSDDAAKDISTMLSEYEGKPIAYVSPLVRERQPDRADQWMQARGYGWPLLKAGDTLAREYGVRKFPTYVLLGFDGEVLGTVEGYAEGQTFNEIRGMINDYLAEKGVVERDADESGEG